MVSPSSSLSSATVEVADFDHALERALLLLGGRLLMLEVTRRRIRR